MSAVDRRRGSVSGPKCISYSVEHLAAVRAAALAELGAEVQRLQQRAARLAEDRAVALAEGVTGLPVPLARPIADGEEPAELERAVSRLRFEVAQAEAQVARAVLQHRSDAGLAALTAGGGGRGRSAADALDAALAREGAARPAATSSAAHRVSALLDRLPANAPPAVRTRIRALVERALRTGAPQVLDELGLLVDRAAGAVVAAGRARALLDAALGLPDVDHVRRNLRLVEEGEAVPTDDDWRRWEGAVAAARTAAERAYVLTTTSGVLAELGYDVGPRFATALAAGSPQDVALAGWDGYAVRLRVGEDAVNVNVVRDRDVGTYDAAVEDAWCDDVAALRSELLAAGVRTDLRRAVPAGTAAVQQVAHVPRAEAAPASRAARRRKLLAKERPL